MRKILIFLCVAMAGIAALMLSSCEKDDPDSGDSFGSLVVNGVEWPIKTSAPNYGDRNFCYWGSPKGANVSFLMLWEEDLTDVEIGDELTPDLIFPTQDLYYSWEGGYITVEKISGKNVTLKFHNVRYEYTGSYIGLGSHNRNEEFQPDNLTVSGTFELIYNP